MMRNKDSVLCAAQPASVFRAVDACAPCCHNGMDWNHWDRNVRQCSNSGCNGGWDNRTGCDNCNPCTAANASSCDHGCTTGCTTRTGCDSRNTCATANANSCNHNCTTGCTNHTGCDSCTPCTAAGVTPCNRSCAVCPNCNGCTACTAARCPVCARTACSCGGSLTPAMVYETPHCLNDLHGMEEAIRKGTLFSELYMPMNGECADACGANLCEGQAEAFAAWELRLYLNTHPYDQQALEMFRRFCHRGDRPNYACAFAFDDGSPNRWSWTDAPWPWEFNAACENNCCCN